MPQRAFMEIARALGDESRVRALMALRRGELCVCQIIGLLGLAPSTVSKHLTILRQAGLVDARKQGRWMYYRIAEEDGEGMVSRTLAWLEGTLGQSPQMRSDERRLNRILKIDPELLCDQQREGVWSACPPVEQSSACCSSAPETPAAARWRKAGRGTSKPSRSKPSPPAPTRTV
jgi:ArsR family transcriptional regulator, arsenate/arsenite/antimonite-responsive transcriptional repressor